MAHSSSHRYRLAAALGVAVLLAGCTRRGEPRDEAIEPAATANQQVPKVPFTDITRRAGITFTHTSGASGRKLLPETMGSGVAFLDFDGDGHQDLFFVNSRAWPGFERRGQQPTLALYRNQGDGTFTDVTGDVGLDLSLYGMGVAVGDFDNDGRPDLFVTAVGGSRLLRNVLENGKARFVDVTARAGDLARGATWPNAEGASFLAWNAPIGFPSSAAFLDYDLDGWLDLFVCNYVEWSPHFDLSQGFSLRGQGRAYGPPAAFGGTHSQLLRNQGNGTFTDVSRKAGIEVLGRDLARPVGKALGVIVCDPDADGWPDLVVANDTVRNFFFHNQRDGTFRERGEEVGIAYADGKPRGAMGIDWGEYRAGQSALLIGNFANEPDTLLRQERAGPLLFTDVAAAEGLAGPSRGPLVFNIFFFDYDLDGRLDLLSNNGHLEPGIATVQPNQTHAQAPQLFWNTGGRPAFVPVTDAQAGADLFERLVGRGAAHADIDGNGTPDLVLTENGGPARLLRNDGGTGHHWVRLVLIGDGRTVNSSAIGARVVLHAGGQSQSRDVLGSRGYLSACELPVTFGLGPATRIDRVEVHWPGRARPVQVVTDLAVDRTHLIRQGK
jgi:hypothetical protein